MEDATDILAAMARGERSAEQVVRAHLERIDALNPAFNFATGILADRALAMARSPRPGPLSGLPVTIKEHIQIEGLPVTFCSTRARPVPAAARSAAVVRRLEAAGAIPIARTNMSEMTIGPESDNLRFGLTRNPLDPTRTAGGSSGGEAAAVACGASAAGIGSDIGGSIRYPAHCCGVVGFKPAAAAVDKDGVLPDMGDLFSDRFLALGPLTRSVRDARLLYSVIAHTPPAPLHPRTPRLLIPEGLPTLTREPCVADAARAAARALEASGAIPEAFALPEADQISWDYADLVFRDVERASRAAIDDPTPLNLAAELWRQAMGRPTVTTFVLALLIGAAARRPWLRGAEQAEGRLMALRTQVHERLGSDGILVMPTTGELAPPHGDLARRLMSPRTRRIYLGQLLHNALDLPCISVPARALADPGGLVPGVSLACAPGAEGALFLAAEIVEAALAR